MSSLQRSDISIKKTYTTLFQYLPFLMLTAIIILIIINVIRNKKSLPVKLFIEAQRIENDGYFEKAVIAYGSALNEAKKIKFHRDLKNRIISKLQILNTVIEYKNNIHSTR